MSSFSRSLLLSRACFSLLRSNPRLLLFPIMGFFACLVELLLAGSPLLWQFHQHGLTGTLNWIEEQIPQTHAWHYVTSMFLLSLVINFTLVFIGSAMMGCVLTQLEGGQPSIRQGFAMARSRIRSILLWSLVGGIVSSLIQTLANYLPWFAERLLAYIGVLAWSMATFFMLPILVFEGANVRTSLRRSAELMLKTFGQQVSLRAGFTVIFAVAALCGLLILGVIIFGVFVILPAAHTYVLGISGTCAVVVYLLAICIIFHAMGMVLNAVLYSYAATGMLPQEFPKTLLPVSKA